MEFMRLSREGGEWSALWKNWDDVCTNYGEQFSEFAPSALSVLKPLAEDPQVGSAGVFGLKENEEFLAACQLNVALLPKYEGKVLRLRHLVLSPEFDFSDENNLAKYIVVLSNMFAGAVKLANSEMEAKHLKLHLLSPADREFFSNFSEYLSDVAKFSSVKMGGAWLYITI